MLTNRKTKNFPLLRIKHSSMSHWPDINDVNPIADLNAGRVQEDQSRPDEPPVNEQKAQWGSLEEKKVVRLGREYIITFLNNNLKKRGNEGAKPADPPTGKIKIQTPVWSKREIMRRLDNFEGSAAEFQRQHLYNHQKHLKFIKQVCKRSIQRWRKRYALNSPERAALERGMYYHCIINVLMMY